MAWKLKVEIRPSPIHGRGVFAKEDILKGEKLCQYDGRSYTLNELKRLPEEELKDITYRMIHPANPKLIVQGFKEPRFDWGVGQLINDFAKPEFDTDITHISTKSYDLALSEIVLYFNKSLKGANCSFKEDGEVAWFYALRDIRQNEELFQCYGPNYWLAKYQTETINPFFILMYEQLKQPNIAKKIDEITPEVAENYKEVLQFIQPHNKHGKEELEPVEKLRELFKDFGFVKA